MNTALTAQQRKVLDFIAEHQRENSMPPTRAEIARHFGWASPNAAEQHLQALERKGAIRIKRGISRGIFVIDSFVCEA